MLLDYALSHAASAQADRLRDAHARRSVPRRQPHSRWPRGHARTPAALAQWHLERDVPTPQTHEVSHLEPLPAVVVARLRARRPQQVAPSGLQFRPHARVEPLLLPWFRLDAFARHGKGPLERRTARLLHRPGVPRWSAYGVEGSGGYEFQEARSNCPPRRGPVSPRPDPPLRPSERVDSSPS